MSATQVSWRTRSSQRVPRTIEIRCEMAGVWVQGWATDEAMERMPEMVVRLREKLEARLRHELGLSR